MDKKQFWENKIQVWEKDRYKNSESQHGVGKSLKKVAGSSLQFRFEKAVDLLTPIIDGMRILDIGCGSGLLYEQLKGTPLKHYTGMDLSEGAIESAKKYFNDSKDQDRTTFISGDLSASEFQEFDIAVALGVLDWLNLEEIDQLFAKISPRKFMFTISEKTFSLTRFIHSIYVILAYGWKTHGYVPQYYTMDEIIGIAERHGYKQVKMFRDKKLRFGAFVYQLD